MKISRQFDERLFKQIADTTGNKQIKKDISVCLRWYWENGYHHAYVECIDESAFIIAYKNAKSLRVYGICTAKEKQGGGMASYLLQRAYAYCKENNIPKITTRTYDGVRLYQKNGYKIVGRKGKDYLMEIDVK